MLVAESCPTCYDPMDCCPAGSLSMGFLKVRILEWIAIPFSRGDLPHPGIKPGSPALQPQGNLNVLCYKWRKLLAEDGWWMETQVFLCGCRIGLPRRVSGKESTCQGRRHKRCGFYPRVQEIPWKRKW